MTTTTITRPTTTETTTIQRWRALVAPLAILLVILGGCGAETAAVESEDAVEASSHTTVHACPKPSAGNLLVNPGFDASVAGWSTQPGASMKWVEGSHRSGCPDSGFAAGGGDSTTRIYQCVPVAPATKYDFGMTASSGVYCDVETFSRAGCAGPDNALRAQGVWINVDWSPDLGSSDRPGDHSLLSFTTTHTDRSARVSCYSYFETRDANYPYFIDRMYLTPSPGGY